MDALSDQGGGEGAARGLAAVRVTLLVNGSAGCAMAERARALASRTRGRFHAEIAYRGEGRVRGTLRLAAALLRHRPHVVYVLDCSASGVVAASLHKLLARSAFVLDTGDAVYELARSSGLRGPVGLALTRLLEEIALRWSDALVVRGSKHRTLLEGRKKRVHVIQDGVDTSRFGPRDATELRRRLGVEGRLTVGVVGSSVWSRRLGLCYGWDLVEAMAHLRDVAVTGILIGDGTGIPHLRARCRQLGIEDRVVFVPRVPYEELPLYLSAIDVCLSTQTNDVVGNVRTTGKLPLYLAAGRYVLASDVGEASLVLEPSMRVPYEGTVDREYPLRLAARIREVAARGAPAGPLASQIRIARERFDYDLLSERFARVIESAGAPRGPRDR